METSYIRFPIGEEFKGQIKFSLTRMDMWIQNLTKTYSKEFKRYSEEGKVLSKSYRQRLIDISLSRPLTDAIFALNVLGEEITRLSEEIMLAPTSENLERLFFLIECYKMYKNRLLLYVEQNSALIEEYIQQEREKEQKKVLEENIHDILAIVQAYEEEK